MTRRSARVIGDVSAAVEYRYQKSSWGISRRHAMMRKPRRDFMTEREGYFDIGKG